MRRHAHLKPTIRALSICFACAIGSFALATSAVAGKTRVAVASNFMAAAKAIGVLFEKQTGHSVIFSFGATGQLYTQITQGAPYDAFLTFVGNVEVGFEDHNARVELEAFEAAQLRAAFGREEEYEPSALTVAVDVARGPSPPAHDPPAPPPSAPLPSGLSLSLNASKYSSLMMFSS